MTESNNTNTPEEPYEGYKKDLVLYKDFVIVEPYEGFCCIGCVMGIMNYFLGTTFGTKDCLDIIALMKYGNYDGKDVVDEMEIATFFHKLGFTIELFGYSKTELKKYISDPIKFLKNKNIDYCPNVNFDHSIQAAEYIFNNDTIKFNSHKKGQSETKILDQIQNKQAKHRVFLIGGDYYIFRNEEDRRIEEYAGHMVICTGTKNKKFVLHDPGPYAKPNMLVDKKRLIKAINYYGEGLTYIMIEFNGRDFIYK